MKLFWCPYVSAANPKLTRHEKPYACKLCPYAATQKSVPYVHARTHRGGRPFVCALCPYASGKEVALWMPMCLVRKAFACPFCPFECTTKSDLKGLSSEKKITKKS